MAEDEINTRDQTSWNLAAAQAQHIFDLLKKSTEAYLKGNLGRWFWHLSALREMINYELKPEEREKLDEIEKGASKFTPTWQKYQTEHKDEEAERKSRRALGEYSKTIKKYQRKIMDLLKEMGFFPSKEDRTDLTF